MSELDTSDIRNRSEEFARALGAEESIYVGNISPLDIGGLRYRVTEARRAINRGDTIFETALAGLNQSILPENISDQRLSPNQHVRIIEAIERIEAIKASPRQGQPLTTVCLELYGTYLDCRADLEGTTPGYILRGIGDNVAIQYGLSPELSWEIYQTAVLQRENTS